NAVYARELAQALAPYRNDNFAGAAQLLEPVARKHSRKPEPSFYLGVSLLLLDRPADAVKWLENAKKSFESRRANEAAWYLSVALQRAGDLQRAVSELDTVCSWGGTHQAEACKAATGLRAATR